MPMDAPVIARLSQEINGFLPVKVDKIFQPYADEFIFSCYGKGEAVKLLISLNSQFGRIHLFDGMKENPAHPSAFCMLLRKYFGGAKLIGCETVPFERIVKLTFEVYEQLSNGTGKKYIWAELTGKTSNLAVTGESGFIIEPWRKTSPASPGDREMVNGARYELPSTGGRWKPVTINFNQFSSLIGQVPATIPLEKFFLKHWYGLSGLSINEITRSAGLEPATSSAGIPEEGLFRLYHSFSTWTQTVESGSFTPACLYGPDGQASDYAALMIHFLPENYTVKLISNLNQVVAQVQNRRHEETRFKESQQNLARKINLNLTKALKKLAKQESEAVEAGQSDQLRIAGELLTTYGYQIPKGRSEANLLNHYDPEGKLLTIPLNPALTAHENARVFFKKYQKAKKGQLAIAAQIEKTREAIAYLESIETLISSSLTISDLHCVLEELEQEDQRKRVSSKNPRKTAKKVVPSEPRKFVTPDGHVVMVGRNNLQNDRLTFKIAGPEDLWFHTQKIPGSHVILKPQPGVAISDQALNYACQLAVYFSKAQLSTKVPVDYTQRKNVKKPPGSKPGFVIYDFFKTAIISQDLDLLRELGIGNFL
jgi:predicted ribosome quality control (RQC) complex YloA/Tae2 family protein